MIHSVIGFPRVGKLRELKFITEKYFKGEILQKQLEQTAAELREEHWRLQKKAGIDLIPSNDFSFYDGMLDLCMLLNVIPDRYKELSLNDLDTFFAMARGYQGEKGDVKALAMKKWFNTNYHYLVPEFYDNTKICLANRKPLVEYAQAKNYGIETKPVLIGAFTFLKLARYCENKKLEDFVEDVIKAYIAILESFDTLSVSWVQFDEPILVTDLTKEDILIFTFIYEKILERKGNVKILLQTYFGDVRDCYQELIKLDFDGIGLDFVEGKKSLELIKRYGFPKEKRLFAGIVNGKNIWKCNYHKALVILKEIKEVVNHIAISTSCSLLHVPYTIENETKLDLNILKYFAFAKEKLIEIKELGQLANQCDFTKSASYLRNQEVFRAERVLENKQVLEGVHELSEKDFIRKPSRCVRQQLQKEKLKLPFLPTTTIGSFPQTIQVKQNRLSFRKGGISRQEYDANIQSFIKDCIELQEELGFDVFVHGEFERNDMVEFFGENLEGYLFTEKAWVLSYGTRCVKPPIIFGDVKRTNPITVSYAEYANQLTQKPVKGMLTGPVTILNWSFPREDISLSEMAFQIALAIREEVLDLEKAGVKIIQIDEAALKEKLPLRREDWHREYLDWAIKAFRLCHSKVKPETQIHTHMCYSEFEEIVKEIDELDADVISFEASRSNLSILDALQQNQFETEVGPGVYDIHSPRIPSVDEIEEVLKVILYKVDKNKLWVNPDCGLKTRGGKETKESLRNLIKATKNLRKQWKAE
jgi:5-methyltetrahydropteroyltriglutamate--homocysteine methyltransferase